MIGRVYKGSVFLADYARIVRELCGTNPDAANRFCDVVEQALQLLASHPQLGAKAGFRHAPQIRKWVIRQFPNYLLFSRRSGGWSVVGSPFAWSERVAATRSRNMIEYQANQ